MTAKRLLIYFYANQLEQASWLMTDETGQVQQVITHGQLTDLSALPNGFDVTVIIPGHDVLLTTAELPKMNRQRLIQALPFALEEKLIDDISQLHFAMGEYQPDLVLPVAVVTKEKMDVWLQALKQIGIAPKVMLPATLALPFNTENWHVCCYDEICMVRTGKYSGFTCDKNNLHTFLELQLAETLKKPDSLQLYNFSAAPVSLTLDTLVINEISHPEKNFLESLNNWIIEYPYINLLQGIYHAKQKVALTKKVWLIAGYLTAAWLILLFLSSITSFFILRQASSETEQAINKIYKQNFPEATAIVAPRERMEAKLKKVSSEVNKNQLLSLLNVVGASLSKAPDVHLLNLDFRNNLLNLTITATSFDHLDAFTDALTKQGLSVKQQSAGMADTQVKANLLINKGGL